MSSLGSGGQAQAHALLRRFAISAISGIVALARGYFRGGSHGFPMENVSPRPSAAQRYAIYQEIRGVGDALRSTPKTRGQAEETTFFRQLPDHAVAVWTLYGHALMLLSSCLSKHRSECSSLPECRAKVGRTFSQAGRALGGKGLSGRRCLIFPKSIMDTLDQVVYIRGRWQ